MQLDRIPIDQLNPAKYNPRVDLQPGDPVYEKLKRSVEDFGYVKPIVVNRRSNTVVGGHQRLKVLRDLGYEEVDVVFVDLSEDREKALNLALNKIVGQWDEPKLAQLLQEFEGFPDLDVRLTGFDDREISDVISRVLDRHSIAGNDDEFDVDASLDEQHPAITQPGELIELGEHRLLCGDSTKIDDVRRVMNGERSTLFATDPPYLVGYDGTNHPGSPGQRDKNKNWSGSYAITWDDAEANPDLYEGFCRVAAAGLTGRRHPLVIMHNTRGTARRE